MRFTSLAKHKIELATISAVLALLVAGFLANRTIQASRDDAQWVSHTYEVLKILKSLEADIEDVISNRRGFALTGNREFITEAETAARHALANQSVLQRVTLDNPEQQALVPELQRRIAQTIRMANRLDTLAKTHNPSQLISQSAALMSDQADFLRVIETFRSRELALLAERLGRTQKGYAFSRSMLIWGTLLGLAIIVLGGVSAIRDNRKRRLAEEELFVEKERAQITLSSIGEAVISVDAAGRITFINQAAAQLTGWPASEALGRPFSDVFKLLDGTNLQTMPNRISVALKQGRTVHLPENTLLVSRNGTETPIEDTATPIYGREGNIVGAVKVFRDVSAARDLTRRLHYWAQHDHLTGLPNRLLLNDRLAQALALAKRQQTKIAVLFLDLDDFKKVNDELGHAMGDKLLQAAAVRLGRCLRECDTLSRFGGDEFVALLGDVGSEADAMATAERLLQALTTDTLIDGHQLRVTCSIGLAIYPDDSEEADTLLVCADTAMYAAKLCGRNACRLYRETTEGEGNDLARRASA